MTNLETIIKQVLELSEKATSLSRLTEMCCLDMVELLGILSLK
jgi:hypothetical protein